MHSRDGLALAAAITRANAILCFYYETMQATAGKKPSDGRKHGTRWQATSRNTAGNGQKHGRRRRKKAGRWAEARHATAGDEGNTARDGGNTARNGRKRPGDGRKHGTTAGDGGNTAGVLGWV